jgi:hypothetical protein
MRGFGPSRTSYIARFRAGGKSRRGCEPACNATALSGHSEKLVFVRASVWSALLSGGGMFGAPSAEFANLLTTWRNLMAEKSQRNYKLSQQIIERLDAAGERWHCTATDIVEMGIDLQTDPDLCASVGDGHLAAKQALACWADLLDQATRDNAKTFSRSEWNYLADVNNGCSPLFTMLGAGGKGLRMMPTMLWANVEDGQRLDGTGEKWFPAKQADQKVAELSKKLQALDFVHSWAVVVAIQFFWQHTDIDHGEQPWWTLEFRRELLGVK